MSHEDIKATFADAVSHVVSSISQYTASPGRDFTRSRKIGADRLISFLVSCGSSGTRIELLDFFGLQAGSPSASAFNQQRAKLRPEALEAVFHRFNSALQADAGPGFRFLAADGSTFTFFSRPSFASPSWKRDNTSSSAQRTSIPKALSGILTSRILTRLTLR